MASSENSKHQSKQITMGKIFLEAFSETLGTMRQVEHKRVYTSRY